MASNIRFFFVSILPRLAEVCLGLEFSTVSTIDRRITTLRYTEPVYLESKGKCRTSISLSQNANGLRSQWAYLIINEKFICCLSVDTFQMEYMETTHSTLTTPCHPYSPLQPTTHHPYPLPTPTRPQPLDPSQSPYLLTPSLALLMRMLCQWAKDPWSYFLSFPLTFTNYATPIQVWKRFSNW